MAVLTPIQDGMAGDPDLVMAWIKNGNYGTALPPMAQDGANTDNTLDLGTTTARWRKVNAGGVVAGTTVGSFTVPERRFARYVLPAKDLSSWPDGGVLLWTVDITSLGRIAGAFCTITLFGDDYNFSTGAGTVVTNAQSIIGRSDNYGYAASVYPIFETRVINTAINIYNVSLVGSYWDALGNYIISNLSNFDGVAQNRGRLDVCYTPLL